MSSLEFSEWRAYARLEPFGPRRADTRAALLAMVTANLLRSDPKSKPFQLEDFMFRFGEAEDQEDEPEPWELQLAYVEYLNAALGGKDLRGKTQCQP